MLLSNNVGFSPLLKRNRKASRFRLRRLDTKLLIFTEAMLHTNLALVMHLATHKDSFATALLRLRYGWAELATACTEGLPIPEDSFRAYALQPLCGTMTRRPLVPMEKQQ